MNLTDFYLKKKSKKVIRLMKEGSAGKIIMKLVALRLKNMAI